MAWYVPRCYNGYLVSFLSSSYSKISIVGLNQLFCITGWCNSLLFVVMHFVSDLYGVNVRPVAPFGSASRRPYVDPALIHRSLPDELLFEVFHASTYIFYH